MKKSTIVLTLLLALLMVIPVQAQNEDHSIKSLFQQQFSYASRVLDLAKAMPADTYSWSPEEGVRSVGEVYTHIAQANYMMIGTFGVSAPVDVQSLGSLTDKDEIVAALEQSNEFVLSAAADLSDEQLSNTYELFGRTVNGEGLLVFILNHMSEHVGQSIAYARSNGVTPPWSE
ncbi:DinB family protein [Rhodohalobacter sp. 614A]|uniref:DinB family protein n=1 Tax=Rhodohalobacter sp. 614A TaxID=2908649 RepID=UPI001F43490B|nr:DinB family protein [Rhodohalobacter sp. 614A]